MITARNSLGLMMPFWKADLDWSYKFISTSNALMMMTMALIAPLLGTIIDRFGSRVIYTVGMTGSGIVIILCSFMTEQWELLILFSLVGGITFAAISPSLVSTTIAHYFKQNLGLATSLATSGSTGGQFAIMPLLALLVTTLSWRSGYLILGILILFTSIAVFFLIGKESKSIDKDRQRKSESFISTLKNLIRLPTFWLLGCGFFICGFTTAGVVKVHMIPYAVSCGFPPVQSATAYGVLSLFSLIGMITYGFLSDRFHRPLLLASCYFFRALTFIIFIFIAGNTPLLYIFAILFGMFDYATFPIVASLVATHVGRHIMGLTMGLIFALHSFGGALGAFMGGLLYDLFARYNSIWIISVALAFSAALMTIFIKENREGSSFSLNTKNRVT